MKKQKFSRINFWQKFYTHLSQTIGWFGYFQINLCGPQILFKNPTMAGTLLKNARTTGPQVERESEKQLTLVCASLMSEWIGIVGRIRTVNHANIDRHIRNLSTLIPE